MGRAFSFAKNASKYDDYAIAQKSVAFELCENLYKKNIAFDSVVDLGCGSGGVYRALREFGFCGDFVGIDISEEMLALHPVDEKIQLVVGDFDTLVGDRDLVISSSSLQWMHCMDDSLCRISRSGKFFAFGIFTSESLSYLHRFLGTNSPLRSRCEVERILKKYFEGEFWYKNIILDFESLDELLANLKNSGILGGGVGFSKAKKLFEYPYSFLDYEVLMFIGVSKSPQ